MFKTEYIIFLGALLATYFGVGWFRAWTLRKGYLDHPNERSSHSTPTPRGGGLVIAAVTLSAYVSSSWLFSYRLSVGFIVGAVLVVGVSWLDDIYSLSFIWRILVHSLAAICVILDLGYFIEVSLPLFETPFYIGIGGCGLAFVWIVGLVNAYNFMDGIDGIAGVQAFAAGLGWLTVGLLLGIPTASILGGTVLFASIGFLIHNWQPAKIFMGDAGSAFLGFTFSAVPLLIRDQIPGRSGLLPVVAVLFLWLFVFDAALTLVRRLLRGERIWAAHREHLYQRMVIAGRSHQLVSSIYGAAGLSIALPAALYLSLGDSKAAYFLLPSLTLSTVVIFILATHNRRATNRR